MIKLNREMIKNRELLKQIQFRNKERSQLKTMYLTMMKRQWF
jgi:hypothetical protein